MDNIALGKADWPTFEQGIQKEWLVTNGIGGYASSTVICANTRKYHGLLVASLAPPVRRTLLLASVDERFETGGRIYNLASKSAARGVTESGFIHLQRVLIGKYPTFLYSFVDVFIEKTVFMIYGKNSTLVLYRIKNGASPSLLRLFPLVNSRDFHWTTRVGQNNYNAELFDVREGAGLAVRGNQGTPLLWLACGGNGTFNPGGDWVKGMVYPSEQERGEDAVEDHYIPGHFVVKLDAKEEKVFSLLATTDMEAGDLHLMGEKLLASEIDRSHMLLQRALHRDEFADRLTLAADAFIVQRQSTGKKSVIAGYHWFNDWGRDAMIALPGLTLVTGRFNEAREILLTFASFCKQGLIPNTFPDTFGEPLYNSVDASLWYFNAVFKYLQYSGDYDFVIKDVYPVLKEIVRWYIKGTQFNIGMDDDGLIFAGTPDLQLTWMDAKVDRWVVTPRHGKPVEISALWFNALNVLERLASRTGEDFPYRDLTVKVGKNFVKKFWFEDGGYFYDVIDGENKDARMRPNQVIAMALPFSPIDSEKAKQALRRVWQELYATYGLRSLSCYDPEYRGVYIGDRIMRDGAYHQGTVWSWLMGPFITAYCKAHGDCLESRKKVELFVAPFKDHLRTHGVGYISEIFDGNDPVVPRGCIAQAWGVAEILRAYVEDVIGVGPNK